MTGRLVVLASGSGSNLAALIDAIDKGCLNAEIAAVIVNRRSAFAQTRAAEAGIDSFFAPMGPFREAHADARVAREAYDRDLADQVAVRAPDLVVCAGWMHLFTSCFLDRFPGRVVNLHPALPGEFPGAHAIDDAWAAHCAEGLARTGVMIHLVPDEGVDAGPVLRTEEVAIRDDDTREALEERIHEVEHRLLVAAVSDLVER